ncbi:hypothetical protein EAF00_008322 [Botryotinia globosa]|nr:hypothetical protein EAF00_008322 [Botryotinia globosa]
MSDNIISKRKRSNTTGRSKYGCLTCRAKTVKYDERLPSSAVALASSISVGHPEGASQNQAPIIEAGADMLLDPVAEWLLPDPQSLNVYILAQTTALYPLNRLLLRIYCRHKRGRLEHGVSLNNDEELALTHYRTVFSLSQTTRDPQWSTPTLLLIYALKHSEMLLHLILAVSLHDMPPNPDSIGRLRQTEHKH